MSLVCANCGVTYIGTDHKEGQICPECKDGHLYYTSQKFAEKAQNPTKCANKLYDSLQAVLDAAYERAAEGKGKERHANGENFLNQPILAIPRALGGSPSPLLFQAVKKIYECQRLQSPNDQNELLDAIVYLAAAVLLMMEKDGGKTCGC